MIAATSGRVVWPIRCGSVATHALVHAAAEDVPAGLPEGCSHPTMAPCKTAGGAAAFAAASHTEPTRSTSIIASTDSAMARKMRAKLMMRL